MKWVMPGSRKLYIPKESIKREDRFMELMLTLTSFDIKSALQRISGNEKLYIDIIKKFYHNYIDFDSEIERLFLSGDIVALERQLHTLKGVAGNIGANDIQYLAKTLETKLKFGENILELEEYKTLQHKLKAAMDEIASLKIDEEENKNVLLNDEEFMKKMNELKKLLDEYDGMSEEKMKEINATLMQKGYKDQADQMYNSIRNYDMDNAQKICKTIISKFNKGK